MILGYFVLLALGLLAGADETVYAPGSGALAPGWENWSWSSTIDFASTAGPGGVEAISVTAGSYAALSLFDETFAHDSIWWSTTLSSRQMSRCWGDISVEVEHSCELRVTSAVCGVSETDPTGFSKMFNNCGLANQTHKALG